MKQARPAHLQWELEWNIQLNKKIMLQLFYNSLVWIIWYIEQAISILGSGD